MRLITAVRTGLLNRILNELVIRAETLRRTWKAFEEKASREDVDTKGAQLTSLLIF
jgi:hypothetical protein